MYQTPATLTLLLGLASSVAGGLIPAAGPGPGHGHAPLQRRADSAAFDVTAATLDEVAAYALEVAKARVANSTTSCTAENLTVRKLW